MKNETLKLYCFKKILSSIIKSSLEVYNPTRFVDLMETYNRAETDIKHHDEENKLKIPLTSQSRSIGLRFKLLE